MHIQATGYSRMPKKSDPKKLLLDTVQFRPGPELGKLISDFADAWRTSRGDAAKRLVALAIHGLDLDFAPLVQELTTYLYGNRDFDDACHQIHVMIDEAKDPKAAPQTHDEKLDLVKQKIAQYRMLRGLEEVSEQTRLQVRIVRTR